MPERAKIKRQPGGSLLVFMGYTAGFIYFAPAIMLKEGEDYYWENGFMVFTETYHKKRGHCCGNGCRHCPYNYENVKEPERSRLRTVNRKTNNN